MARINLSNLRHSYFPQPGGPDDYALKEIDVTWRDGGAYALLGPSGCGKSTLLNIISGLLTPSDGKVLFDDRDVTHLPPDQRNIAQVFQFPVIYDTMTVRQNLVMGGYIHRGDREDVEHRLVEVLDLFPDLADRQGQRAGSMSGGQQQMLALARVLLHDPEILLIDELSLGLAPTVVQDLLALVERLQERGQTIILVEQSLNVALSVADRAIFLEKGQIRFEGPARELLERDDLARAVFLGREGG